MTKDELDLLLDDLARYTDDPLGFVMWAFPWGEKGTDLEGEDGPEQWQIEQLDRIGKALRAGGDAGALIEEDVVAGHGVGKSAQAAFLILWAISTREHTRGVVTANTDAQLKTKTWAELGKWHRLFIARDLVVVTATAVYSAQAESTKTWRIDQSPWSKENTEAFAGMHNKGNRILVIFDESAAIHDNVWEVTEGALTDKDTQIIWCRYGNPTRTSGQFHRRCTQPRRNTVTRVDSRDVQFTNKSLIAQWIEEYGEDSDFVRVRVKGLFPRAGQSNFIATEVVEGARRRVVEALGYASLPKILSCDPARFGDDSTVITLRQGTKVHWQRVMSGYDGTDVAGRLHEIYAKDREIAALIYDAIGNGADLDSALRRAPPNSFPRLVPVMWGVPARDSKKYFNMRAECWGLMRDWLATGSIPDSDALCNELTSLDYGYDAKMRIQLQSKKDIKRNGGKSPDHADSLALSFMLDAVQLTGERVKAQPNDTRRGSAGWT